ncbi:hypothetical protein ACWFPY_17785 [Nocardia fluminea]
MPDRDSISLDEGYDPADYATTDHRPVDRSAPFVDYDGGARHDEPGPPPELRRRRPNPGDEDARAFSQEQARRRLNAAIDGDDEREAQEWARGSATGVVAAVEAEQARRIPSNAPRPQDHLKARKGKKTKRDRPRSAVEREARGIETVAVPYDGEEYVIPAEVLDWSLDATIAFEEGRAVTAMRILMTPKQFRTLMSKGYTNRQFAELFDLLAKAGGFENSGN